MGALGQVWLAAIAALAVAVGAAGSWGGRSLACGLLAGGLWNLASLWCLSRLLSAWVAPQRSKRLAITWLVVKFPLLYGAAVVLLRHPALSLSARQAGPIGFGLGVTVVLVVAVGGFGIQAQRLTMVRSDGR